MTLVKFGMGGASNYNASEMVGMIYFATDTNVIYLNGIAYGVAKADLANINAAIKTIVLGADQKTLTLTTVDGTASTIKLKEATAALAGLMSAADKTALNTLNGAETVAGSVKKQVADAKAAVEAEITNLEATVAKNKITAGDNSINVDATGDNTKVNVKIKANAGLSVTDDGLAVDEAALTTVSAGDGLKETTADGVKTISSDLKIIQDDTTEMGSDILHQYWLSDSADNKYGIAIEIPKDKSLIRAYMGHIDDALTDAATSSDITSGTGDTALCFIYQIADGTYNLVSINVTEFLASKMFGDGLTLDAGVVKAKVDSASETFLTVSANGIKLTGVADAIAAAVKASSVVITEVTSGHVQVTKTANADGGYTYSIVGDDIASAADLTALTARVSTNETAITGIKTRISNLTGQSGEAYVADTSANYIDDATSLQNADKILDTTLKELQDALTWYEATE